MKLSRRIGFAFSVAIGLSAGMIGGARAQVNPFNPDFAFCNTQGSLAVRGPLRWQCLTPGTAGQVMVSGGAGAQPGWLTVSGAGTVSSVAATVPAYMTVTGSPITTIGTLAFGFGSQSARTFFAAPPGAAGTPAFRTMVAGDLPNSGVSTGDVTGTYPTTTIAPGVVTNAKMADMPNLRVKANYSGVASPPGDYDLSAILNGAIGSTIGTLIYRDNTGWIGLAPGTNGQMLTTGGPGANPTWTAVTGNNGGTVTGVTCGTGLTGGVINVSGTCAIDPGNTPGIASSAVAGAGIVGQVLYAETAAPGGDTIAANTAANLVSITLTPGDWDVSAMCYGASVSQLTLRCNFNTVSGAQQVALGKFASWTNPANAAGPSLSAAITPAIYRVSTNTTLYLVGVTLGTASSNQWGAITARRVR